MLSDFSCYANYNSTVNKKGVNKYVVFFLKIRSYISLHVLVMDASPFT